MKRKFSTIALALATLLIATPGWTQSVCGERNSFLEQLDQRYKEAPTAIGVIDGGSVLELLTSQSGSWTILVTAANGTTCMVATGENWETLPKLAMGPKA